MSADADRFDRFTVRAQKVLTLAQHEAQRLNHNHIGTEHLLLGLVREGEGVAARVLQNMGIFLSVVRERVERVIGRGDRPVAGEVGLQPGAKRVIELALDEARRLGQEDIGTEHLLLGLVREREGIAAGVLRDLGAGLTTTRRETLRVIRAGLTDSVGVTESAGGVSLVPVLGRQHVSSGSPFEATIGFSRALRTGDRILISGTAPIWPDGSVDPDPAAQARRCLQIIVAALAEAGGEPRHVVRTRMYLTNPDDADAVGRVHGEVFGEVRPAATMVVVSALLDPRWRVEIEAEAILD